MKPTESLLDRIGRWMAARLTRPSRHFVPYTHQSFAAVEAALRPGDVLLVEGDSRIAGAIKYLTQSTWSHAALYVGRALDAAGPPMLVEVNLGEGCVAAPLAKYECYNLRICRATGLNDADRAALVAFMIARLGTRYDMRYILDLMRYFLPEPPVPRRFRRRMLALGAGDPTRAICSSMIAQAFQSIRYPILPRITHEVRADPRSRMQRREILHIRHHSLFAPRDFDLSPYFGIVKPTIARGFDHRRLFWADAEPGGAAGAVSGRRWKRRRATVAARAPAPRAWRGGDGWAARCPPPREGRSAVRAGGLDRALLVGLAPVAPRHDPGDPSPRCLGAVTSRFGEPPGVRAHGAVRSAPPRAFSASPAVTPAVRGAKKQTCGPETTGA